MYILQQQQQQQELVKIRYNCGLSSKAATFVLGVLLLYHRCTCVAIKNSVARLLASTNSFLLETNLDSTGQSVVLLTGSL